MDLTPALGDTTSFSKTVSESDVYQDRTLVKVEVSNDWGELVGAATHQMTWLLHKTA